MPATFCPVVVKRRVCRPPRAAQGFHKGSAQSIAARDRMHATRMIGSCTLHSLASPPCSSSRSRVVVRRHSGVRGSGGSTGRARHSTPSPLRSAQSCAVGKAYFWRRSADRTNRTFRAAGESTGRTPLRRKRKNGGATGGGGLDDMAHGKLRAKVMHRRGQLRGPGGEGGVPSEQCTRTTTAQAWLTLHATPVRATRRRRRRPSARASTKQHLECAAHVVGTTV